LWNIKIDQAATDLLARQRRVKIVPEEVRPVIFQVLQVIGSELIESGRKDILGYLCQRDAVSRTVYIDDIREEFVVSGARLQTHSAECQCRGSPQIPRSLHVVPFQWKEKWFIQALEWDETR
jgi:hypothetical protein